jgi:hypothetical protein
MKTVSPLRRVVAELLADPEHRTARDELLVLYQTASPTECRWARDQLLDRQDVLHELWHWTTSAFMRQLKLERPGDWFRRKIAFISFGNAWPDPRDHYLGMQSLSELGSGHVNVEAELEAMASRSSRGVAQLLRGGGPDLSGSRD